MKHLLDAEIAENHLDFSTLDSGLRDETGKGSRAGGQETGHFSTLDSGLRDETVFQSGEAKSVVRFQYPRLGSTR